MSDAGDDADRGTAATVAGADRNARLQQLVDALSALIVLLARDPDCHWHAHFVRCHAAALVLLDTEPAQQTLDALAASVLHVYGGMGSFNDYAPFRNGRLIRGMESLDTCSADVHQAAGALRAGPC